MIKGAFYGIAALLIVALTCILLWLGLLTLTIQPDHINHTDVFTIERGGPSLQTAHGRVTPVGVVESSDSITYTFVVRRK